MTYSFLDLAYEVLKDAPRPLTVNEIWAEAEEKELDEKLNSHSQTPPNTLRGILHRDEKYNPESKFFKARDAQPQLHFLTERRNEIVTIKFDSRLDDSTEQKYTEKDLHPLLAYFVHTGDFGGRKKPIYTKTIDHKKTKKSRKFKQLQHPDMVGVYYPFDYLEKKVFELSKKLSSNTVKVLSFELKKCINKSNYREYFSQAVSNSSWAHEGYLVIAEIEDEGDFHSELERLSNAFGIGIIKFDINDFYSSEVLFSAKTNRELDWDTVGKLYGDNTDFMQFVDQLNIDLHESKVNKEKYDEIIEDPVKYIRENLLKN